jgi:hypothetical protein
VRHRTDAKGKVRHTTVELLVESTPIRPRRIMMVFLKIEPNEHALRAMVKTAGGVWDANNHLWKLPSRVASILGLRNRIVAM